MAYPFRTKSPIRNYKGHKEDYHAYKDKLAEDFNHRCGYTDCPDHWFGGKRAFQIDHFRPWSKYPDKKTDYNNLVYCCSYVNRAKWDNDSVNFLDPCDNDYNEHFERDVQGVIVGKTIQGKYMTEHLCLSLARYAIIWNLERLENRIDKLRTLVNQKPELESLLGSLLLLHYDFVKSLRIHQ